MKRIVINEPSENLIRMLSTMGYTFDTEEVEEDVTMTAVPQRTDISAEPKPVRHFDDFSELLRATGLTQAAFAKAIGCNIRAVQAWCASKEASNHRNCAQYIIDLMSYYFGL